MKIQAALVAIALVLAYPAHAQYEKGDLSVNAGIAFGLIGYGYGYYSGASGFVPVLITVEYSVNDKFAIGPYAGFYSRSYVNGEYRFTALSFGARGMFHASEFANEKLNMNINTEVLDIYAALHLGIETLTWKYRDENIAGFYSNSSRFIFGPVIGLRYFFHPSFGVFIETGRGAFGWATLGVTGKF